ncbi:MAG: hypothetical protein GF315_05680 [candidate division Zixibacteria bacterium]|nr:hypothetical protein [candidate division Zixibacteria bacterium]
MDRRKFIATLSAISAGAAFNNVLAQQTHLSASGTKLLPLLVSPFSSEIVLNSRLSYHSGYGGTLSPQIVSNVLWATAQAPRIGQSRSIYIALPDNVYRFNPARNVIFVHKQGNHLSEPELAFEVGIASDLVEDAGTAGQYGLLASVSFWTDTNNQPCCCPKESAVIYANDNWEPDSEIHMVNCFGNLGTVRGITDELVAISSDQSLPNPSTDGTMLLEDAFADLRYENQFEENELDLNQISQIAWSSYGCTPHFSIGKAALTSPSAIANYYLTRRIYIVRSEGVERYHIRLPSGQPSTRDHRIERVTNGDMRQELRAAVSRLPQTAPNYFVFCAANAGDFQLLEAGFCGANALLQATSIGLKGYFTAEFSSEERTAIINALSIPSGDLPLLVFSAGA